MTRLDPRLGLVLAISTFVRILLLVLQTLNVVGGHFAWAIVTTALIAPAEVAGHIYVVKQGWRSVPWVFIGGAAGVTSAMYFHRLWIG
jgi:hypothetical protein